MSALLVMLCLSWQSLSQSDSALTWNGVIKRAMEQNWALQASRADLLVQKKQVNIARGLLLPALEGSAIFSRSAARTFSGSSGVVPSTTGLTGLVMEQMIYDESSLAEFNIEKKVLESQGEQLRTDSYDLIQASAHAYLRVLNARDLLKVQKKNLELTRQNLQIAQDRETVGTYGRQEVLRWETNLYKDERNVLEQEYQIQQSRFDLNQLLNLPAERADSLEPLSLEEHGFIFSSPLVTTVLHDSAKARLIRDFLVDLALDDLPRLRSLDWQISAMERQYRSFRRWLIPSLGLTAGGYEFLLRKGDGADEMSNVNTGVDFWRISLSLKWNIFQGGSNFSRIQRSHWQLQSMDYQRMNLRSSLEKQIRSSVSACINYFLQVDISKRQAAAANENYKLTNISFMEGEVPLLNLLDAQKQKFDANYAVTLAFYTFMEALVDLQRSTGYLPGVLTREREKELIEQLESRILRQ